MIVVHVPEQQNNEEGGNGIQHEGYLQLPENLGEEDESELRPFSNGVANGHAHELLQGEVELDRPIQTTGARFQGTVVNINGVDVTVYGNVRGLELLQLGNSQASESDPNALDCEEEEEEERQRIAAEHAIKEAELADAARRSARLPAEHCETILNAMRGITIGGFRPSWADVVPEGEWINRVLRTGGVGDVDGHQQMSGVQTRTS